MPRRKLDAEGDKKDTPKIPPSKVEVREVHPTFGEICFLDSRYGIANRGPYRREDAEIMARVDDFIAAAGIVPGDRFKLLMKEWVLNKQAKKMERREVWSRPNVMFHAIENARFLVRSISDDPEQQREWALMTTDKRGMDAIVEIRKINPPRKRSKT